MGLSFEEKKELAFWNGRHNLIRMFAAATPAPSNNGMPFDWFDLVFVAILFAALFRGRHNGMSKELIPFLQWLAILFVCGFVDPVLGPIFSDQLKINKMWGFIAAYAALFIVIWVPFSIVKHKYAKNLAQSDYFKGSEYYLGMIAGVIKWICILLVVMAVLNAPVYSAADIAAHQAYVHQVYGGGEQGFSGDYFPTVQTIQEEVLKNSATGSFVVNQSFLKRLLIQPQPTKKAGPPKPQPVIQIGNQTFH
jgi:uncharacterized membrane protein required for colicin V production